MARARTDCIVLGAPAPAAVISFSIHFLTISSSRLSCSTCSARNSIKFAREFAALLKLKVKLRLLRCERDLLQHRLFVFLLEECRDRVRFSWRGSMRTLEGSYCRVPRSHPYGRIADVERVAELA